MAQTLKVFASGTALVHDFEALDGGVLRFIGRRHDPKVGPVGGFVPCCGCVYHEGKDAHGECETAITVPMRAEYLSALKHGDLEPADEATARAAGLKWPPPEAAAAEAPQKAPEVAAPLALPPAPADEAKAAPEPEPVAHDAAQA